MRHLYENIMNHLMNANMHPKTKDELQKTMRILITQRGADGDFNDVDVSKIKDMSYLFQAKDWAKYYEYGDKTFNKFNGDISKWDVSKVESMTGMFQNCTEFDCDISNWDVSKVKSMAGMFDGCRSFCQDLSKWDVKNVKKADHMFDWCDSMKEEYLPQLNVK